MTAERVQVPTHLSAEAGDYLMNPEVLQYPSDWTDPWLVHEFRERIHPIWCGFNDQMPDNTTITESAIAGVVVETIRAGQSGNGTIVHLHGGMFCSGTPEIDRYLNGVIAMQTGATVVSVEYRLAPEHPFPAALDDALAVYQSLSEAGPISGVLGESAGGGLALALVIAARDAGLNSPATLALMSPMLDLTGASDTYRTLASVDPDYSNVEHLLAPGATYAGATPLDHPLVSPLFSDLARLPPTLVQVGSREVLLGDSTRFTRMARAAGVSVELEILDGGWHNYALWPDVPESVAALHRLAGFLGSGSEQ